MRQPYRSGLSLATLPAVPACGNLDARPPIEA